MSGKKILIIDDEPDVVTYLTAVLESNGYEAFAARDVKAAMRVVEEERPALICLDIMMPRRTGISFYIRLRQKEELKNIPVIIISGVAETDRFNFRAYVKDTKVPPPECYMEKPVDVKKYLKRIRELTSSAN